MHFESAAALQIAIQWDNPSKPTNIPAMKQYWRLNVPLMITAKSVNRLTSASQLDSEKNSRHDDGTLQNNNRGLSVALCLPGDWLVRSLTTVV